MSIKCAINLFLFFLLVALHTSSAYRMFQAAIPNGGKLVNPCDRQSGWEGVGHQTKEGGSQLNPFGIDFKIHGKKWTRSLCLLDSDGDGRSNGEELGDPDCTWKPGGVPRGEAVSHPGICEPLLSPKCESRNEWLKCNKISNLELGLCEHIKKNSTISKDLTLKPTPVPAKDTTYTCQVFDLNLTTDHHMVATQPLIAASEVVHHILLFGCDPRAKLDPRMQSPYPCVMVPHPQCRALIGAWTVGSPGECAHPEMGFRIGPRGYMTVALQIHWNNPGHIKGLTDTSGLRIHLTKSLRKYDAGMLVIGQRYLQVEPQFGVDDNEESSNDLEFSATCPSRCTKVMFKTPIYITSAVNHMHYLGKSQEIKIYNNDTVVGIVTDQHNYDYDDPVIYNFPQAVPVNPGDELRTTCRYKRSNTPNPVCWGEGTSDEMCFGFITYYPLQSLTYPWCTSMKSIASCDRHLPTLGWRPIAGCRWWDFRNASHPETKILMGRVFEKCYDKTDETLVCTDDCKAAVNKVASHPCIKGDIGSYMIDKFKEAGPTGQLFLDAVITCSCRHFEYCERKVKSGLLGSRRDEFCEAAASIRWPDMLLMQLVFILALVFGS